MITISKKAQSPYMDFSEVPIGEAFIFSDLLFLKITINQAWKFQDKALCDFKQNKEVMPRDIEITVINRWAEMSHVQL